MTLDRNSLVSVILVIILSTFHGTLEMVSRCSIQSKAGGKALAVDIAQ